MNQTSVRYNPDQFNMTTPIVKIEEGLLRGKISQDYLGHNYYCFLGIPYGQAPVGQLRFKAPQPIEPWTEIKDASFEGPECPSRHMMFTYFVGSEDNCLNLNVYTRELADNCKILKPVMVWIHGGAFMYGSNKSEMYSPDYLITEDIVLVCINYRLGVLGFLSLKDPSLEVPGNAGMKDMVLALKWVQRNIKHFGGDPNNVTIFGESAGSASVHYLYLSPLAKGLFHKAIAQSGSALNGWSRGSNNCLEIASNLGYKEDDEEKILEYLRKLSPRTLVNAQHKTLDLFEPTTIRPFGPVVEAPSETAFLSKQPIDIIKAGEFNHVPLIMGYTSREGILFEAIRIREPAAKITTNFENEIDYKFKMNGNDEEKAKVAAKIKSFYFGNEHPSEENIDKFYLMRTDTMFLHGIWRSVSNQKLVSKAPIFLYRMSVESSLNHLKNIFSAKSVYLIMSLYFLIRTFGNFVVRNLLFKLANLIPKKIHQGVSHADDLFYIFKTFINGELEPESDELIYVRRFIRLWTNFARTGHPTPDENDQLLNVRWKPMTKEENCFLDIGTKLKLMGNPESERMEFWENIYNSNLFHYDS